MLLEQVKYVRREERGIFFQGCPSFPAGLTARPAETPAALGSKGRKSGPEHQEAGSAMQVSVTEKVPVAVGFQAALCASATISQHHGSVLEPQIFSRGPSFREGSRQVVGEVSGSQAR